MKGTRSGVWPEVAKAIGVLRPGLVVIENVRGLLTARGDEPTKEHLAAEAARDMPVMTQLLEWLECAENIAATKGDVRRARECRARTNRVMGLRKRAVARCQWHERRLVRAIGTVLGDLADLGFDAQWCLVGADDAGGCHQRKRVFIIGWPAADTESDGRDEGGPEPAGLQSGDLMLPSAAARLLPTPRATDWKDQVNKYGERTPPENAARRGRALPEEARAMMLLKTPTAQLAVNGGSQDPVKRQAGGHGPTLADQVEHQLLPTPTVADSRNSRNATAGRSPGSTAHSGTTLSDAAMLLTGRPPASGAGPAPSVPTRRPSASTSGPSDSGLLPLWNPDEEASPA